MPVRIIPTGNLDVNTDPSSLPSSIVNGVEISGAMTRCTNLILDQPGMAKTRPGTSKVNTVAINQTVPHFIVEMSGNRNEYAGNKIYWNEGEIGDSSSSTARWSAIKYNAYNVTTQSIFSVNGMDRKKIDGDSTVNIKYDYAYTYSWEADYLTGTTYQFGTEGTNIRYIYSWEADLTTDTDDSITRHYQWFFEKLVPREWGIDAPATSLTISNATGYAYTYDWEGKYHAPAGSYQFGTTRNDYQCIYNWEQNIAIADSYTRRTMWFFEFQTGYTSNANIGVKYTYCRKSGTTLESESNPSDAVYINSRSGISVSWPFPDDPQVTHVRIYRTLAGDATFYYAGEFAVDLLSAVLSVSDLGLGSAVDTDHDRPPLGTVVAGPTYNGYCFMIKDNLLYFCKANRPEYWPADYYIEVGPPQEPLKGIEIYNGVPYVTSTEEIYMIQGTGADSFFPFPMRAKTGSLSDIGVLSVSGFGIVHSDIDGYYGYTSGEDKKISEANFGPIFKGETKGSIPYLNSTYASNCWLLIFDNKLWFGYPDSTAVYPNNFLITNLSTGKNAHYSYPFQIGAVTVDNTNNRILGLDTTGFVRVLDDYDSSDDSGTSISWQFESKAFTDKLYKYFPRSAKYDVELGTGASATGTILLADSSIQTHTIASRNSKKRLIDGNNGDRLGIRLSGTGTVKIREVEVI